MTVEQWLLDSDPAIRWQVMRDLADEPADAVAAERARVATEGWGARLLALQAPDGQWGGRPWSHDWTDTFHSLELLRRLGLDPESEQARRAVGLVREQITWRDPEFETPWADNRFFEGEVEPCINGNVVSTGAYFGVDMTPLVDRLLGEQLPDGGWNCEVEKGATVSSFGTTINVLEGLLEHERAMGGSAGVRAARRRGEEYLLERQLFRRKTTGEVIDPSWLQFSFPTWYHYDVLRGLEYLRGAEVKPDERVAEAIEVVEGNRDPDGRWPLQNVHAGGAHLEVDDGEGKPSRWNTLRALRVLRWAGPSRPRFGRQSVKSSTDLLLIGWRQAGQLAPRAWQDGDRVAVPGHCWRGSLESELGLDLLPGNRCGIRRRQGADRAAEQAGETRDSRSGAAG